jgi:hypothetical protein
MDIKLGYGIGDIRFGIEKGDLIESIGHPDKIDTDASENPLLIYNELRCTFWMGDDARLHWIQSTNPKVTLFGRFIVGIPIEKAISEVSAELKAHFEREDYGAMDSYSIDSHELELQAEYGVVRTICFGNYWSEDDAPIYHHA